MSDAPPDFRPATPGDPLPNEVLERIAAMMQFTPQARALGVEITLAAPARAWGRIPYRAELVGDPDSGVIAGGVVTTFLDQLCGVAAVTAMSDPSSVATIDLRIDYMRAAEPGRELKAEAHCYKLARHVAFVRASAFEDSPDNPVAHAVATFMVNANAGRKPGDNYKSKP